MPRARPGRPSNAELAILRVLWSRGSSTVREVHEALGRGKVAYTTTLKTLQIMAEKGLARRVEQGRLHRYWAGVTEASTQRRLVTDLIERAFGGSTAGLVMKALSSKPASAEELARIRALIDRVRGEER